MGARASNFCRSFVRRTSGRRFLPRKFLPHKFLPRNRTMPPAAIATVRLVAIAFACLIIISGARAQNAISQYQVKAAYLFNFLKFVEYPEDSFSDPLAPIVIGVVGDDLFGAALTQVVIGKTVQGRDIVIRNYRDTESLRGAHILFIGPWERKKLPQILSSLHGSTVLTVADMDGFLEAGGMIQFLPENDRVRFAINTDATSRARLKLSSKLMSLAKVVGGNSKEAGN